MRPLSLFWRVFVSTTAVLGVIALLLLFSPIEIDAPIELTQAAIILAGLAVTVAANAVLVHRALRPLERLAERMGDVDLLQPDQRLTVERSDEIGRVVRAFNRMLDRLETERRESGARVLAAQEAERTGIARDLHDEVGQLLTGALLQLDAIAPVVPVRDDVDETKETVRRALDTVRRISSELRPELLEHLGLASALTQLANDFGRRSGLRVEHALDPRLPELAPATELAVYRIAQESLTNVARHAEATRVAIALEAGGGGVLLTVVDDGRGLPATREEHGGLRGMRERALLVGGRLTVADAPGGGVEVRLEVPVAASAAAAGAG